MANWSPENPCFSCTIRLPTGEERKSPCCWYVSLELTAKEKMVHFPNRVSHQSEFLRGEYEDRNAEVIYNVGPCPKLDQQTGKCLIEDDKIRNCRATEPMQFELCAKAPDGRWHDLLI
jgi:hypothetical protein